MTEESSEPRQSSVPRLPPLEIVLEEESSSHNYVFLDRSELLQFQAALTGFEVVDDYTEYVQLTCIKLFTAHHLTLLDIMHTRLL